MFKLANNLEVYNEVLDNGDAYFYVLINKRGVKEYIVNNTIFTFLSFFKESNTLEQVIKEYGVLTGANKNEKELLSAQLTNFFKDLVKRKWIVDTTKPIPKIVYEPLFTPGQKLGQYTITELLANNETTEVYIAKINKERKRHVIKVLNAKKFSSEAHFKKYNVFFKCEYDFIKLFNSIYINKGLAYVKAKNYHYMVLEYIQGRNLFRYVKNNKITADQKRDIILKMLKGFAVVHGKGIFHGDIHLGNVIVTKKLQVKIIDFGYSNPAIRRGDLIDQKPRNGGAHAFIPPERALRSIKRKFNAVEQFQSEVYQIGLLIYYLYVKKLPFGAQTWKTMVDEKQNFNINTFEPFVKSRMPKAVKDVIIKSLQKEPSQRYKSAKDLLQEWKKKVK